MRILIIGGEAAGMSAAAKARRLAKDAEIVVYEASEVISFGACGLPYFVGDEFQEPGYMAEFTPEQFAAKGIEVKIGHRVLSLDAAAQTLTVEHNGDTFTDRYDRLMIATGAPFTPGDPKAPEHLARLTDWLTDRLPVTAAAGVAVCRRRRVRPPSCAPRWPTQSANSRRATRCAIR